MHHKFPGSTQNFYEDHIETIRKADVVGLIRYGDLPRRNIYQIIPEAKGE